MTVRLAHHSGSVSAEAQSPSRVSESNQTQDIGAFVPAQLSSLLLSRYPSAHPLDSARSHSPAPAGPYVSESSQVLPSSLLSGPSLPPGRPSQVSQFQSLAQLPSPREGCWVPAPSQPAPCRAGSPLS
ncbi:unnamed protein product [Lepidochelys olivacea]